MPRETRTRHVSPAQVRSYLSKAEEFLTVARESIDGAHTLAATSLAVHAGISACDAICGARTGQRAAGSDHGQAVAILGQADSTKLGTHQSLYRTRGGSILRSHVSYTTFLSV